MWDAAIKDPKSPAYKQQPAHKAEIIVVNISDGLKVSGVLREKSFGEPVGSWTVSEEMMKKMKSVVDVVDSKIEGANPGAAWSAASKRKFVSIQSVDTGTEENPGSSKILKVFTPTKRDTGEFSALDELFFPDDKGPKTCSSSSSPVCALKASAGGNRRGLHYSESVALSATQLLRDAASSAVTSLAWKTVQDRLQAVMSLSAC